MPLNPRSERAFLLEARSRCVGSSGGEKDRQTDAFQACSLGDPPPASQLLARLLGAFLWPASFPLLSVAFQIHSLEYGALRETLGLDLMKAVLHLCVCY